MQWKNTRNIKYCTRYCTRNIVLKKNAPESVYYLKDKGIYIKISVTSVYTIFNYLKKCVFLFK